MAKKIGAKLIITVDCGTASLEAVSYAKTSGIDVIITDHHEPLLKQSSEFRVLSSKLGEKPNDLFTHHAFKVPDAVAVVNPKLEAHNSKFSNLSGAGVAFKFAQALALDKGIPYGTDDVLPLLDLAALGTLADVVPLTGDNRIIIREGLKYIHAGSRPGIRALKEVSGLNGKETRAGRLAFTLVPRINAAGRIADAQDVVRLLLSENEEESLKLSVWLDSLNRERQQIEGEVYAEALERLREAGSAPAIVLSGEGWHQGVLGIVASRIAEEFYRPAFIFSVENNVAKGSARSIPSFDICKGLAQSRDLLLSFGGHKQAAGIKLKAEDLSAFEKSISRIVQAALAETELQPAFEIDTNVEFSEVTHELVREFALLEPCGSGNPEPLIGAKALEVVGPRIVGNKHLKMRLKKGRLALDAIGFDMGGLIEEMRDPVDVVFTPSFNDWNGGRYLQLIVKAVRPSA